MRRPLCPAALAVPAVLATIALGASVLIGACGDATTTTSTGGDALIDGGGSRLDGGTTADGGLSGTDGGATSDTAGPQEDITYPPPGVGKCDYPAGDLGAGKELGEACTEHAECRYGLCLLPGDGNLVNTQFGFCTRGCDCGDDTTKLSAVEKESFVCLYPPGNQGRWRHVVPKCHTVADCTALSSQWTDCKQLTSGGVDFTCHAE